MSFHDVVFPAALSRGSSGGPERLTEIVTLTSGFEERNSPWSQSRRRFDAGLGIRGLDDLAQVIGFFEARQGRLFGFRWKDWSDFKSCLPSKNVAPEDQQIGVGDGVATEFKLSKTYLSGPSSYVRMISKPIAATIRIAVDGVELTNGSEFTVDENSGMISLFEAPADGAPVTAGFEFHVPVRFDTDAIEASYAGFEAGEIPSVPVVEVRV